MADLRDVQPYGCKSKACRKRRIAYDLFNIQYYTPASVPANCPVCGEEGSLQPLQRICLVEAVEQGGTFRASQQGQQQSGKRYWRYYCGRSNDEHGKLNIPVHTSDPDVANCPECLSKYNEKLVLADQYLRVKE